MSISKAAKKIEARLYHKCLDVRRVLGCQHLEHATIGFRATPIIDLLAMFNQNVVRIQFMPI
jgi:hypothetical protein